MKKLSSLLILLAFSLCLCFSASADAIEYYSGTWFLTSIEAGGTAFDPSVLGVEMSMTLSPDGACAFNAMGEIENGTWMATDTGISTIDENGVTDHYELINGQLKATLDGMSVTFTHENDLNASYVSLRANLGMSDFNGVWRLSWVEMAEGIIDKAQLGIDMTIVLEDGAGWCEMAYDGETEKYNLACTLEEAENLGTIMYAAFADDASGEALAGNLMLMLYEDNILVWYTVEENVEFYYCFELETAE